MLHHIKPYFYRKFKTSFSKSGEDIQLWQLLKKEKGVYIDVGAHHPILGNNTYFFYLRGWQGINVEPNSTFEPLYKKFRGKDYLYKGGIANFDGELEYFEFSTDVFNTFSGSHIEKLNLEDKISDSNQIPVITLSTLIRNYLQEPFSIDFLSVDVEGMELEVMQGNDWSKFRPRYILLESHKSLKDDLESDLTKFLYANKYELIGKSLLSFQIGTLWFRAKEVQPN